MIGKVFSFVGRSVVRSVRIGVPIGVAFGSVQLTAELGCWGRDPHLALDRINNFTGLKIESP